MPTPALKNLEKDLAKLNKQLEQVSVAKEKAAETVATPREGGDPLWWSTTNAMTISSVVLGFGILVILVTGVLLRSGKHDPLQLLRIFGTIVILVMAVFLVVAGYNDQQIAPVLGLLGTVAGYLLGKETSAPPSAPHGNGDDKA